MTDTFDIIFDDFGIWLLGYRIEFSCQYFTGALFHKFFVAIKFRLIWILSESPPLVVSIYIFYASLNCQVM